MADGNQGGHRPAYGNPSVLGYHSGGAPPGAAVARDTAAGGTTALERWYFIHIYILGAWLFSCCAVCGPSGARVAMPAILLDRWLLAACCTGACALRPRRGGHTPASSAVDMFWVSATLLSCIGAPELCDCRYLDKSPTFHVIFALAALAQAHCIQVGGGQTPTSNAFVMSSVSVALYSCTEGKSVTGLCE